MHRVVKFAAVGLTALGMSLAGAAWAQQPPPGPAGGPPGGPQGPRGGMGCMVQNGRLTDMLSRAHWKLRITQAEDPAWTKMTQDLTAALQPLADQCGKRPTPATTLPDRLARMVQMGQTRQQVITGVQAAVTTMYDQLAPDQKAEADRMLRWHGHRGPREGDRGPREGMMQR